MKIAIVALSYSPTNGPELTATQLAEALQDAGVDITLFAPADFSTRIKKHVPTLPQSLWNMPDFKNQTPLERRNYILSSQMKILAKQEEFDLVHIGYQTYAYTITRNLRIPSVVLLNARDVKRNIDQIKSAGAFTVTLNKKDQDAMGADAFLYPGVPLKDIKPSFSPGNGLIAVGRCTPQKGLPDAIRIAKNAGKALTIIGHVGIGEESRQYFEREIAPHINGKDILHYEHLPNTKLLQMLSQAEALLFPITTPETFGRVTAEALACGTPVIGTCVDPLPETLQNSQVSFLSNNFEELAEAALHTERFDRIACREYAEKNFDIDQIAKKYLSIYKKVLQK